MKLIKGFNSKKILSLFWDQDGTPYFNAKGIAVGVFSGCFPFFGFQTLLGIFFAKLINGNLVLAAIGTWISNPFTYIPLYVFNFKIGSLFFKDYSKKIDFKELIGNDIWSQGWIITSRLFIGSCLVGLCLGFIFGFLTFYLYRIRSQKKLL